VKVFVPTAPSAVGAQSSRRSLDSMSGKVIGIIDNSKPNFHEMADDIDELLIARYGAAKVVKYRKEPVGATPDTVMEALTDQCDAIIVGIGD
jgi:hypothetical protein